MENRRLKILSIATLALFIAGLGFGIGRLRAGGIPPSHALTYFGVLTKEDGSAVDGDQRVSVELWDAEADGHQLCFSDQTQVTPLLGRFTLPLPDTCTAAIGGAQEVWTALRLGDETLPRAKVGAVPYSVEADHASSADRASAASGELEARIAALEAKLAAIKPGSIQGAWTAPVTTELPPGATEGTSKSVDAVCPAGTIAISGSCDTQHGGWVIWISAVSGPGTWSCRATAYHNTGQEAYGPLTGRAFCVTPQ